MALKVEFHLFFLFTLAVLNSYSFENSQKRNSLFQQCAKDKGDVRRSNIHIDSFCLFYVLLKFVSLLLSNSISCQKSI